jgi:hypothetical protein
VSVGAILPFRLSPCAARSKPHRAPDRRDRSAGVASQRGDHPVSDLTAPGRQSPRPLVLDGSDGAASTFRPGRLQVITRPRPAVLRLSPLQRGTVGAALHPLSVAKRWLETDGGRHQSPIWRFQPRLPPRRARLGRFCAAPFPGVWIAGNDGRRIIHRSNRPKRYRNLKGNRRCGGHPPTMRPHPPGNIRALGSNS